MLKKVIPSLLILMLLLILARALSLNPSAENHTGEGQTELHFSGYELKSQSEVSIEQWRGSWVLLHFWASWCESCQFEFPILQKYQTSLPIIGVRYKDETGDSIWSDTFVAEFIDPQGHLGLELGVMATPESFLINPQGQVVLRHQGPLTDEFFNQEIMVRLKA